MATKLYQTTEYDLEIRKWLSDDAELDGKRATFLRACLERANESQGIIYSPLNELPMEILAADSDGKPSEQEAVKWIQLRHNFKSLARTLVERGKEEGHGPCPILRVTDKNKNLRTGQWITFILPRSPVYEDACEIVNALTKIDSSGPSRECKTWLYEPYLLVYLHNQEAIEYSLESVSDRIREYANASWILKSDPKIKKGKKFLKQLPSAVRDMSLVDVVSQLRDIAASHPPKQEYERALKAYRERIAKEYMYADYRGIKGISDKDYAVSILLEDVYVIPDIIIEQDELSKEEFEHSPLEEPQINTTTTNWRGEIGEKPSLAMSKQPSKYDAEDHNRQSIAEALKNNRLAVILGGTGMGKSVLTQYLARLCALGASCMQSLLGWSEEITPLRISLAHFAAARRNQPSLTLWNYLEEKLIEYGGDTLRNALNREMDNGKALVFLDGIDEELDTRKRTALVQEIDRFVREHRNNRILITSRPYGYIRLAGDLPHFKLSNLSKDQIETFIFHCKRAIERRRKRNSHHLEKPVEEAKSLNDEMQGNQRLLQLGKNPLLLVIIVMVHTEQLELPGSRAELYDRIVTTLMETWNYWRSQLVSEASHEDSLDPRDLVSIWATIGEWTRRTQTAGLIHRTELRRRLIKILRERELGGARSENVVDSYLDTAVGRAGLIEERATDVFAFWHPSLEEYLAAVELCLPTTNAIERILPLRDDARWQETIIFAVGFIGEVQYDRSKAASLLEAIAFRDPSPLESVLHTRLWLACKCIIEHVHVQIDLAERVILELLAIIDDFPYDVFYTMLYDVAQAMPGFCAPHGAISQLIIIFEMEPNHNLLRWISNTASYSSAGKQFCTHYLWKIESAEMRRWLALGLARAGEYSSAVWSSLGIVYSDAGLQFLSTEVRDFLKHAPSEAIKSLRDWSETASRSYWPQTGSITELSQLETQYIDRLRTWLTCGDPPMQMYAASTLYEKGRNDSTLSDVALSLLKSQDEVLSFRAAQLLLKMNTHVDRANKVMLRVARNEQSNCWCDAAQLVMEMMSKDEIVSGAVFNLQRGTRDNRLKAAHLLLEVDKNHPALLEVLYCWLTAKDIELRVEAAELLVKLGRGGERVCGVLLSGLRIWHPSRPTAQRLLVELGLTHQSVFEIIRSYLEAEKLQIQESIALSLIRDFERAGRPMVSVLELWLNADDLRVRLHAVRKLWDMGRTDEGVISTAKSLLGINLQWLRYEAANILIEMGQLEYVMSSMIAVLSPNDAKNIMPVCLSISRTRMLSVRDGQLLKGLVSVSQGDGDEQRIWRRWLFVYLWNKFQEDID